MNNQQNITTAGLRKSTQAHKKALLLLITYYVFIGSLQSLIKFITIFKEQFSTNSSLQQ